MFFQYRQNNSFGTWEGPQNIIVEADSPGEADELAVAHGIVYFDGCANDVDCSCCGDRWSRSWEDAGDDVPSIYGEPAEHDGVNVVVVRKD